LGPDFDTNLPDLNLGNPAITALPPVLAGTYFLISDQPFCPTDRSSACGHLAARSGLAAAHREPVRDLHEHRPIGAGPMLPPEQRAVSRGVSTHRHKIIVVKENQDEILAHVRCWAGFVGEELAARREFILRRATGEDLQESLRDKGIVGRK
jgi:hypothetical protein